MNKLNDKRDMAFNSSTEQELIFKNLTGEDFTRFYNKFYPRLVYNLNGITQDTSVSEDLATEAFIKALQKIDQYNKEKAQFSTWLFTIGRRMALQEIKSEKHKKTMSIDCDLDEEGTTLKDFIQGEENNDELEFVINNKKAEVIKREIENLKQPYKKIMQMREYDKMPYKDIAIAQGKDVKFELTVEDEITTLPMEISECYSLTDQFGNETEFVLIKGEHFFEEIKIKKNGVYKLTAREPKKLSTIKSQIRCARFLLIDSSRKEFEEIELIKMEDNFSYESLC